ncbi:MAG TPA: cyclase family protein [Chthoniobacterales bacterium]|jgi:arylformamidase
MKIWDISRPLTNDLAPWPGDTPFNFQLIRKIPSGEVVNLGSISLSVHNGTHADAVFHFDNDGPTIEQAPLGTYVGQAAVVDLAGEFSEKDKQLIEVADLLPNEEAIRAASRLLVKTGIWLDSTVFPSWIPVITPGVAAWLGERGVKLLGIDVPSVDPIDAKVLANHHALGQVGIWIMESLDLREISAGLYNFAAFPLKIAGGDGAPVRAVLWRE